MGIAGIVSRRTGLIKTTEPISLRMGLRRMEKVVFMRVAFLIFIALAFVPGVFAEMREWTNAKGRHIQAELVSMTDDTVTLRRENGSTGTLPRSGFSTEDQHYLTELEKRAEAIEQKQQEKKQNTVSISRRKIMLDDEPYIIKGVCYNPVPKGSSNRNFDRLAEDLDLMAAAGINTIRVYSPIDDQAVLDTIHKAGLKVIIGFGYNNGAYSIRSGSFIKYVDAYKDHGAILFWELGNEYNYHPEWFEGDIGTWHAALNKAARTIHRHDPSHPVATAHGGVPDDDTISACPDVDLWGINAYSWDNPTHVFSAWKAISSKPMYLSEAGADGYMTTSGQGYSQGKNEDAQADAVKNILDEIFSAKGVCAGVTLFAFVDEWWKAGNPATQDATAIPNAGFPYDGAANEEYWGIVDIDRNTKKAYEVVKKKYNRVR